MTRRSPAMDARRSTRSQHTNGISWCSISCCPISTASTCSPPLQRGNGRRASSCCPPDRRWRRASRSSTAERPTFLQSHSPSTSCSLAFAPRRARVRPFGHGPRLRSPRSGSTTHRVRSISTVAAGSSSRFASTRCWPISCARPTASSRASGSSTRSGSTSSIRARTSSTSASAGYGASLPGCSRSTRFAAAGIAYGSAPRRAGRTRDTVVPTPGEL
jgi:hypothetical protein